GAERVHRVHVPAVQPPRVHDRVAQRRAAAGLRGSRPCGAPGAGEDRVGEGRARRSRRTSTGRAVGWSTAAGGDRARARDRAGNHPGRRADREPRVGVDRRGARAARGVERRGPDDRPHHARARRRASRPADYPAPRRPGVDARPRSRGSSADRGDRVTWLDTLRTATDAVRTHRLRSALTMLGILIGITAVVLTVGLGDGARADERSAASVVVLGPDTASELFTNGNPVGQSVSYNGVRLQVVGVLTSLSSSEQTSNNDLAIVPLSTYQQRLVGGVNRNSVSSIYVKAASSHVLSAAYQEADTL